MNRTTYPSPPLVEKTNAKVTYTPRLFTYMIGDSNIWFMVGFTAFFIVCWRLAEILSSDGQIVWPVYLLVFPFMIVFTLGMIALRIVKFSNVAYELSGHTIIIKEGVLGWTYKVLRINDIRKIQVNQNLIQGLVNVGTIRFYTDSRETDPWTGIEKNYEEWNSVSDPQGIVDMIIEAKEQQNA